jgi:hypothetical protein
MDIRIKIALDRDTDNSYPECVVVTGDETTIEFELGSPYRLIRVNKESMIKALNILTQN